MELCHEKPIEHPQNQPDNFTISTDSDPPPNTRYDRLSNPNPNPPVLSSVTTIPLRLFKRPPPPPPPAKCIRAGDLNTESDTESYLSTESDPPPRSRYDRLSNANPLPPVLSSLTTTPVSLFKRPSPPPSPVKCIRAFLARIHGSAKPNEEGSEVVIGLDKNFGYSEKFASLYELGEEMRRGTLGYTCSARGKKGSLKGQDVAVKVIPKSTV